MFEVGFTEILLILGIALLVLGPERLPKLAADVGRWTGRARAMARQLKTQLEQEASFDPLRDEPKPSPTIHTPGPTPAAPIPSPASTASTEPSKTVEPSPAPVHASATTPPPASPAAPPAAAPDRSDEPQPS